MFLKDLIYVLPSFLSLSRIYFEITALFPHFTLLNVFEYHFFFHSLGLSLVILRLLLPPRNWNTSLGGADVT